LKMFTASWIPKNTRKLWNVIQQCTEKHIT
jgi:hypothetical protein